MRNIVVVPYDPQWPVHFREEAALITKVFGDELISIHHIGSTAIPGMSAKPVIDIMPVVRNVAKVETFNSAMIRIGYEPKGEFGIVGRRHFVKGSDASRTHICMLMSRTIPKSRAISIFAITSSLTNRTHANTHR